MSTVALTIDYSNGVTKHITGIPWKTGMTILEAIEASERIVPKGSVTFGSDRSGHVLKLVIDDIPFADAPPSDWVVWVNAKGFHDRLGTPTSFGFHPQERARNLLEPGDHVLVKFALLSEAT